jgi:hypothetical protein
LLEAFDLMRRTGFGVAVLDQQEINNQQFPTPAAATFPSPDA